MGLSLEAKMLLIKTAAIFAVIVVISVFVSELVYWILTERGELP